MMVPAMRTLALALVLCLPLAAHATKIQAVRSPGGITAWLVQERTIPLLSINFSFAGGATLDDPARKGTGNMVSVLLDEGAGPYNALAFQTRLEELAVRMSFSADRDSFSGNMRTLTANCDAAFELLRLALNEPRFGTEAVERMRGLLGKYTEWNSLMTFLPPAPAGSLLARSAVAATFSAALEMTRAGQLEMRQGTRFGPIHVRSKPHAGGDGDAAGNVTRIQSTER